MTHEHLPKPVIYIRTLTAFAVGVVAIITIYNYLFPQHLEKVKTKIVQVKQGDGYVTEQQCRDFDAGEKKSDIRKNFGVPVGQDNDGSYYSYKLREDHDRQCTIDFGYYIGGVLHLRQGSDRIVNVNLDLAHE